LLAEAGYLGGIEALERLLDAWRGDAKGGRLRERARRAAEALLGVARELSPLRSPAPAAEHLGVLMTFLTSHEIVPPVDGPERPRHLRAREAILTLLGRLRAAYVAIDPEPVAGDEVAALVRRWIEGQTFAPRNGDSGVHLVDADSARFGRFDHVHIAGVVDNEWPDRSRRNIFYSVAVLRELGWPEEADRLSGARAAFADLLRLPASRLYVSTFVLESDVLVGPSPLLDEVEHAGLDSLESQTPSRRIFEHEALCCEPIDPAPLGDRARLWIARRQRLAGVTAARYRGFTDPPDTRPYSLSALERYQDCPFKFFAAEILRLEEEPEDESIRSPRARGLFIHQVFEHFFQAWDRGGGGSITPDRLAEARALMVEVAEPLLATLPESDAAIERTRLFGSAISTASVDIVFGHEVSTPSPVTERLLEYRLEGEFSLGSDTGRRVALRGVADRIDLLDDHRLRVVDYKSGNAPNPSRALQVPIYALCAKERLEARDGRPWHVEEATYLSFTGKRSHVTVVKPGSDDGDKTLASARRRAYQVLDGVADGRFPPQPHDPIICDFCAYAAVCRKDYVHD